MRSPETKGLVSTWTLLAIVSALIVAVAVYPLITLHCCGLGVAQMGQFGDMFGILNTLISILGFAGILAALNLQHKQIMLDVENQKPAIILKSISGVLISAPDGAKLTTILIVLTNAMNTPLTKFGYSMFGLGVPVSKAILFGKNEQSDSNTVLGLDILVSIPVASGSSSGLPYFTLAISTESEDIRGRKAPKTISYYMAGRISQDGSQSEYRFQSVLDPGFGRDIEEIIKRRENDNQNPPTNYCFYES